MISGLRGKLKILGFNENEILIYLELLNIGNGIASSIASRTKLNKSSVRYACKSLESRGLIFSIEKDGTYNYYPESPKKISNILDREREELHKKEESLKYFVDFYENLSKTKTVLPKITFYEGKDGIKNLYNDILNKRETIYSFEEEGQMLEFFPEFVRYFIDERKKRKINNLVICPTDNPINDISKLDLRNVKKIDKNDFPFTGDIKICGDKVSIISFKDKTSIGVSIVDQDIANNFKVLFDYFWNKLD